MSFIQEPGKKMKQTVAGVAATRVSPGFDSRVTPMSILDSSVCLRVSSVSSMAGSRSADLRVTE